MSFAEKLNEEEMAFFNEVATRPFAQQAVAFLNAYWNEVGSQAEFIFGAAWETIKYADMNSKGIAYVHQYEEGVDLELNIGLYFYEKLCKYLADGKDELNNDMRKFSGDEFKISQPSMMTAITRKKELKEKVDVNFDGRISMLEYLLYQYKDLCNPADFCKKSMAGPGEHEEIRKARLALEEVNRRIQAYEAEKVRLETESKLPGVKGLKAKNLLAQLDSSPLAEELNVALIKAEAAVRKAVRFFGGAKGGGEDAADAGPTQGAIWWMNKDLSVKQAKYGKKK